MLLPVQEPFFKFRATGVAAEVGFELLACLFVAVAILFLPFLYVSSLVHWAR